MKKKKEQDFQAWTVSMNEVVRDHLYKCPKCKHKGKAPPSKRGRFCSWCLDKVLVKLGIPLMTDLGEVKLTKAQENATAAIKWEARTK